MLYLLTHQVRVNASHLELLRVFQPMIDIIHGDPGPLTQSLLNFVQEMTNGSAHGTVTPNALFSHVCKKSVSYTHLTLPTRSLV